MNSKSKRKAVFIDRDGVMNKDVHHLRKVEDFELLPRVSRAIQLLNNSDFLTIVITNQSVVARNLCDMDMVNRVHNMMREMLAKDGAKIDAVYFCPHHPDKDCGKGESDFRIECDCRKPNLGMVKKAQRDYNLDLKKCYLIGDNETDIICGKRAGMKTIGVKTGLGCECANVEPDYHFNDLFDAVTYIGTSEKLSFLSFPRRRESRNY